MKNSPFGHEIVEIWKDGFGCLEQNYDGYIYLGGEPIDKHKEYRLTEIYTEEFVKELKRRAFLLGDEDASWFGVPNNSLTLEDILKDIRKE